jgi:hypothetical protein
MLSYGMVVYDTYVKNLISCQFTAMVTISLSHASQIDVTMAVNKEFAPDPATMARMTNGLIQKELESLVTLSEALS